LEPRGGVTSPNGKRGATFPSNSLKIKRLNVDSSQFTALCDQEFQEGSEQAFAPEAGVMHELKEAQIKGSFC
jgi:hypothetical protein